MRRLKSSYFCFGLVALLLAFRLEMPFSMKIADEKSEFFKTFPMDIAAWKGTEVPPDEKTLEILETRNVLTRTYEKNGMMVHLLLVSSRKDRRVAHPPEVCYVGSNFNILDQHEADLETPGGKITVKEFTAQQERQPDHHEEVLYLYRIGNRFTINYYAQQLQFALDKFTKNASEVLLIRVAGGSREAVRSFFDDLVPLLSAS